MKHTELVAAVKGRLGCTNEQAKDAVDALLGVIKDEVRGGREVNIAAFGKFSAKHTAEREGRNPATGEPMRIKASVKAAFKPAKGFMEG